MLAGVLQTVSEILPNTPNMCPPICLEDFQHLNTTFNRFVLGGQAQPLTGNTIANDSHSVLS